MAKYKVYECEAKVTGNGKELKKLVLQGEGKQYPDKNVTMWPNHPLYAEVAAGQTIDVEIDIQDSKTPNPKGGFYKNKTVINQTGAQQANMSNPNPTSYPQVGSDKIEQVLNYLAALRVDVTKILGIIEAQRKANDMLDTPEDDFQEPTF